MSGPVRELSFSGGEIAPALYARTDHVKYDTGLRTLRNFICMRHGGVTGRPGTQYVGTTLNGGNQVRLIPFIFNETGNGQSYVLEFGNLYIAFYQNGGVVESSPGVPYTVASPYLQADLADLKFAESADVITIVHPSYQPRELSRVTATNWILNIIQFAPSIESPSPSVSGGNTTLPKVAYKVVAVASTGEESSPGLIIQGGIGAGQPDLTHPSTVTWPLVTKAISYRIYRSTPGNIGAFGFVGSTSINSYVDYGVEPDYSNGPVILNNPFSAFASPVINFQNFSGFIGVHKYAWAVTAVTGSGETSPTNLFTTNAAAPGTINYTFSWDPVPGATSYNIYGRSALVFPNNIGKMLNTTALTFTDNGTINPNLALHPPAIGASNNPSTVGFVQQRRAFANTILNPIGFWLSQPGLFYNFNTHLIALDSDAILGSIAGEEVNEIEFITELKFMLMLTAGAEIYVAGNGSGVVTPSAINASTQSQYGCSSLRPLKVGDVLLFNQALGSFIRDFSFDFAIDGYRGNDITIFSAHLFEGSSLSDWAYQKIPDSIIWAVRSDGVLLSCTYVREQQILAWARHDFTNGIVENICAIPENGNYAVYLSIKRIINGSTVRYIERISSRIWTDPLTATYLDCYASYDGRNTGGITFILIAVSGGFSNSDTAYQQPLRLNSGIPFFSPLMIGDQIFIQDALFVSSHGAKGEQIRLTIQSFTNATEVIVTPNRSVPAVFQGAQDPDSTWSRAVQTVTGLDYLEGQEVSVWADRFVVGSPLNEQISTVYTVVGGSITLDKPYTVIYVGLPMTQDIQTLDLETAAGDTMLARRKLSGRINIYTLNTRNLFAGSENPDDNLDNTDNDPLFQLIEQMGNEERQTYDEPPQVQTDQDYITFDTRWNYGGRVFIRNVDPVPLTILSIAPEGQDPSANSGYKKV